MFFSDISLCIRIIDMSHVPYRIVVNGGPLYLHANSAV
jgi:hypothetical protein